MRKSGEKKSLIAKVGGAENLGRNFSVNRTRTLPLRYQHSLMKQYDQLIKSLKEYTSLLGSIVGNGLELLITFRLLYTFSPLYNLTSFQQVPKTTSQSV